jgi:ABC-type polysaccharide/polyol phosphate transport system ATPase subunit
MAEDIAISAEGLGKKYLIDHEAEREPYVAFRDAIAKAVRNALRLGADGLRGRLTRKGHTKEEFWALKEVSFEIAHGEVVGIVGRNGAGKSTLLKILSRITEPSEGRVTIEGRVASLLEVGTGFHPELTGRENIFLNGAILGMTHAELRRKFDEIVAFAEVERFLDTPVKRYSSGMYVRLAFAVAAHIEPEILIVDEVLAVGDAAFQKKCLGRMSEVSASGRTVLFVSHNVGALLSICDTGILLDQGRVIMRGPIQEVVRGYADRQRDRAVDIAGFVGPLKALRFEAFLLNGAPLLGRNSVTSDSDIVIEMMGEAREAVTDFKFALAVFAEGKRVFTLHDEARSLPAGPFAARFAIPRYLLRPHEFVLGLGGRRVSGDEWTWSPDIATVEVIPHWTETYAPDDEGLVNLSAVIPSSLKLGR